MTLPQTDDHVQHTWTLINTAGDEISIDLCTDDYTVRIDGGPDDGDQREGGRADIDHLLTKYKANGYRPVCDYPVNPAVAVDSADPGDYRVLPDRPATPEAGA